MHILIWSRAMGLEELFLKSVLLSLNTKQKSLAGVNSLLGLELCLLMVSHPLLCGSAL